MAAHIVLHEMGWAFDLRRIVLSSGEHLLPEYIAINPRAQIPTLLVGEHRIRELSGILMWLGQQGCLRLDDSSIELARCGEWLAWLTSRVHISFGMVWRDLQYADDQQVQISLCQKGYERLKQEFQEIETDLVGPYALGSQYSIVDPNLLVFYRWGRRVGCDMSGYQRWSDHTARMLERDAVKAAVAAEGIEIYANPDDWTKSLNPPITHDQLSSWDQAWQQGNVEGLISLLHENCLIRTIDKRGQRRAHQGKPSAREALTHIFAQYSGGYRVDPARWTRVGDMAFNTWRFEFLDHNGGLEAYIEGVEHLEFRNGQIVSAFL